MDRLKHLRKWWVNEDGVPEFIQEWSARIWWDSVYWNVELWMGETLMADTQQFDSLEQALKTLQEDILNGEIVFKPENLA